MGDSIIPVEAICERDIDLLLLEEIHVSQEFRSWLVEKTFDSEIRLHSLESAQHSVFDSDGESDICFRFRDSTGVVRALLIENKVAAPPQPEQASRYRKRGESGVASGSWTSFRTCIVAPSQYLASGQKSEGYDAKVSYEDIEAWFQTSASEVRSMYRAGILRDAVARARRIGISRVDPQVTAFWSNYWAEASVLYPELELREPKEKGPDATWVVFHPKRLGKNRTIDHKLSRGCVDLSYPSLSAKEIPVLAQRWERLLKDEGMSLEATGKSVAVRLTVPELSPWDDFHDQRNAVREGMKAAFRLLSIAGALEQLRE